MAEAGPRKNYHTIRYGTRDGELQFGHIHQDDNESVESEDENILICSPCSGHGFKFTPAIGEICSELVAKKKTNYDLSEFSIKRLMK